MGTILNVLLTYEHLEYYLFQLSATFFKNASIQMPYTLIQSLHEFVFLTDILAFCYN